MKPRLNALQEPVAMQTFECRFVWSEYLAPWCSTSAKQAVEVARRWSDRFQLDPRRVIAADLRSKTIPEHRFYSPQGHTLFVHAGYLNTDQIRETINYYKVGWEKWFNAGEAAAWMTFNRRKSLV